jgi:hypothetical protein
MAASNAKRRIGCKVTSAVEFRIETEAEETFGLLANQSMGID